MEDLKKRLEFARRCARQADEVWMRGISFYLDGMAGCIRPETCKQCETAHGKKSGEALRRENTAKGKKEGVGGKMARFMVGIAQRESVIGCHHHEGRDGEKFSNMANTSLISSSILPTQHVSYSYKMVTPHKTARGLVKRGSPTDVQCLPSQPLT